jgi:hypothetical protein
MTVLDRFITRRAFEVRQDAIREFLACPAAQALINPSPLGPNADRPEHGTANLANARAYHERLAARGERDES